jgi:hypothetical protein
MPPAHRSFSQRQKNTIQIMGKAEPAARTYACHATQEIGL